MIFKNLLLAIVCLYYIPIVSQEKSVWEDFKTAKETGIEAILPDFSYAGYKYSETALPTKGHEVFNVLDYGAIPNDNKSDKRAVLNAIKAAKKKGSGIVFFPKGTYHLFTKDDDHKPIEIDASNIVFRGEEQGESILFFENNLEPTEPDKLWTTPNMIVVKANGNSVKLADVISDAKRETFTVTLSDASKINKNDWVILSVSNNDSDLISYDIQPLKAEPEWTSILEEGVIVNERHQVASVNNNVITFYEPIHYDVKAKHHWEILSFEHVEEIGFENLTFEGNWKEEFEHHKSAKHDGGWSILCVSKSVNSWVKDCTFKNINNAFSFSKSAACTALNITIEGNIGHSSVHSEGSTGILLAKINDLSGMHHAVGVGGGSNTGTVIWRSKYPSHTSFEAHASQPRCTLFDNVEGGFFAGRAGGARFNLPNHGRYLVLWNFKEIDEPESNFKFVATDTWWWRIVPPIVVGFHGSDTTFKENEIQILEGLGTKVKPESLFEEQLKLRLGGKLPKWMITNNYCKN
ncbi:hypothetical protein GCM10007028_19230 [Algibacter mikhailovii]|uniref:DUF4955 domain-containing protein n=2 Tax=Algibacter mikhailovii TaxID=425498 RepID=A0A918R1U4_9FLAO|nr:hypothetical protein GCM10007028_19230 [Algibacter mikhailovii]